MQANLKIDKDNVIFVFGKGCLHAVSSIDGEVLWKKDFADERFEKFEILLGQLFLRLSCD